MHSGLPRRAAQRASSFVEFREFRALKVGPDWLTAGRKAVRKHHGYVTLVMNGENGELLYLAEGKKKESLQGFFDKLTAAQKASIVAVGMDRAGACYEVVKAELPAADIVFDKFHLIANYNAVIDDIRRVPWLRRLQPSCPRHAVRFAVVAHNATTAPGGRYRAP